MTETYKKYLYNQFRETYQLTGVPAIFYLKGKEKREKPIKALTHPSDPASYGHREEEQEEEGIESEVEEHTDLVGWGLRPI